MSWDSLFAFTLLFNFDSAQIFKRKLGREEKKEKNQTVLLTTKYHLSWGVKPDKEGHCTKIANNLLSQFILTWKKCHLLVFLQPKWTHGWQVSVISLASAGAVPKLCGKQALATQPSHSCSVQEGRLPLSCILGPKWGCNTPALFFNFSVAHGPQKDNICTGVWPQWYCPTEGYHLPPDGTNTRVGGGCLAAHRADSSPGLDLEQLFKHTLQALHLERGWRDETIVKWRKQSSSLNILVDFGDRCSVDRDRSSWKLRQSLLPA